MIFPESWNNLYRFSFSKCDGMLVIYKLALVIALHCCRANATFNFFPFSSYPFSAFMALSAEFWLSYLTNPYPRLRRVWRSTTILQRSNSPYGLNNVANVPSLIVGGK